MRPLHLSAPDSRKKDQNANNLREIVGRLEKQGNYNSSNTNYNYLNRPITRRAALSSTAALAGGLVGGLVIGGLAGYFAKGSSTQTVTQTQTVSATNTATSATNTTTSIPTTSPTGGLINTFVYSPLYVPTGYTSYLTSTYNITLTSTEGSAATEGDQIVSSGGSGWDTTIFWDAFSYPVINASPAVLQPYNVSAIPDWNANNLDPLFVNPQSVIGTTLGNAFQTDMWWPGKTNQVFAAMCPMFGVDSFGMNAQMISTLLTSWGDLMNRQWKGKVEIQDIPTVALANFALYLVKSNQMTAPAEIYNLSNSEVDTVINYLQPNIAAGQVAAFWDDYGTSVSLMTSGEVWIGDMWNAAVFSCRAAGTPAYYILPKEGVDMWVGAEGISALEPAARLPLIYEYLNSRLGGTWAYQAGLEAYQTPSWPSQAVKNAFPIEFYNWNFLGQATYEPITQIIPNQSAYVGNALFQPTTYKWSSSAGTPSSSGNIKDRGSISNIESNTGTIETWVDNAAYYISEWTTLKQAA